MDYQVPNGLTTTTLTTTGGTDHGNCTVYYPWDNTWPYSGGTLWVGNYGPVEPVTCIGKAHVFECEHVSECKCGAVKRIMPRAKKGKAK